MTTTLTTINDPATAALHWFQQLDAAGRERYDELVAAAGVDVEDLSGWAQLTLTWLAGEHERMSSAVVEILTARRHAEVVALLAEAGMPELAAALATGTPA